MFDLYYYTGVSFWIIIASIFVIFVANIIYTYISVSVAYWLVHILAHRKYPNGDAIRKSFRNKVFWRVRLLFWLLSRPKLIYKMTGNEIYGNLWSADFTGFIPKIKVK